MSAWYEWIWIYFIYAFFGWVTEVIFVATDKGKFVNRGFLNGPVCPIYGVGVAAVIFLLAPFKERVLILYLGAVAVTTLIEYLTGFILEKVFKNKWWDYSDEPFNISGYVCLKFSLLWGIACLLVVNHVHPLIMIVIHYLKNPFGFVLLILCGIVMIVDICDTVATIFKFNRRLKALDEMAEKLRMISDEIGENIADNAISIKEKGSEFKEKREEYKKTLEKYEQLLREKTRANRLLKAFPTARSQDYKAALNRWKEVLQEHKFRKEKK